MKLAMAQMKSAGSQKENLRKSLIAIEESAKRGADMILFPEVQLTEFFPQYPGQDVHAYGITLNSDMQMSKTVRKKRPYTTLRRPELYI